MQPELTKKEASSTTATQHAMPVELSPELYNLLKSLAEDNGSSTTEILNKGLVLMGAALKAKKRGLRLGIADINGYLIKEITGF